METLEIRPGHTARLAARDARLTNAELAQRVGLSAAPCWRRVRALEESGFIRGYRAEIDRHKIGLACWPSAPDAERSTGELTQAMERAIAQIPEVVLLLHQRHRHLRAAGCGA